MYYKGWGVIKYIVYANMWVNISASNGDKNGKKIKDLFPNAMTPSQIEEAERLARESVKKNYKGC